jgi:hypothetical protein
MIPVTGFWVDNPSPRGSAGTAGEGGLWRLAETFTSADGGY